jgi:hypothetical protein
VKPAARRREVEDDLDQMLLTSTQINTQMYPNPPLRSDGCVFPPGAEAMVVVLPVLGLILEMVEVS